MNDVELKTGERRQETGDRRQETGDRRQETGDLNLKLKKNMKLKTKYQ